MSVSHTVRLSALAAASLALAGCGAGTESGGEAASDTPTAFGQCQVCHSVVPGQNGIGPSLAGVFGKPAASEPSFAYSRAMRDSGLVWDETALNTYLANPRTTVAGTSMSYAGLRDDAERAELIEWLKGV